MKIEANPPIHRLLEKAYHEVGGGQNLQTSIDGMRKVAEKDPHYKAMFPYQNGFENAAKAFLKSKGLITLGTPPSNKYSTLGSTVKLEAQSRLSAADELTPKQEQLDVNKDGKISGDDLKKIREGKTPEKTEAASYPRLLKVFDDEAAKDPKGLKSLAKNWVKNKFLDIDADIDRAFSGPRFAPNAGAIKKLKARLTALNEV